MARTPAQVETDLENQISTNFAPAKPDTRNGSALKNVYVQPEAQQISAMETTLDTVSANQSIISPESLSTATMNGIGANFNIQRLTGTAASGILRFVKFTSPTSNIPIPSGTQAATNITNNSDARTFLTLAASQLTPTSPADPITGAAAYVDIGAQAAVSGSIGNVDANTITVLLDAVPGVDLVYNPNAMTGGADSQSNTAMADLIKARASGRLGTRTGYEDEVRSNFSVLDTNVIGPSDADAVRTQFGGEIDIIILNNTYISTSQVFSYVNSTTTRLVPAQLPLVSVYSITGFDASNNAITLLGPATGVGSGTDYDVVLDTTGPLAGSLEENSAIVLHPTTNIPGNGTVLTVSYNNNQLVRVIQSYLDSDLNKVLGADILVKAAVRISVGITANIRVVAGYTASVVQSNVTAAVQAFFTAQLLGTQIDESDLISVMQGVAGVQYVDIPTFQFYRTSDPTAYVQTISANGRQLLGLDNFSLGLV